MSYFELIFLKFVSYLEIVQRDLVGRQLSREEGDADDEEEEAVEARTHNEQGGPENGRCYITYMLKYGAEPTILIGIKFV